MTISISAHPQKLFRTELIRGPTFVGTGHPLEIVCKSSLSSVQWKSEPKRKRDAQISGFHFHPPARPQAWLTHMWFTSLCSMLPICRNIFKTFEVQSARNIFKNWGLWSFKPYGTGGGCFSVCNLLQRKITETEKTGSVVSLGLLPHMDRDHPGLDQIGNHFPHLYRKYKVCSSWE